MQAVLLRCRLSANVDIHEVEDFPEKQVVNESMRRELKPDPPGGQVVKRTLGLDTNRILFALVLLPWQVCSQGEIQQEEVFHQDASLSSTSLA